MGEDDRIRVVIVDDIAETRENIRKLLQFENDIEVVGVARTGSEGINIAKEMRPDVILMDINMPDMDGIVATENIRRTIPHTQIVILSVQGDTNYMRRAMLAGARDFITKPPSIDDLTAAIRRAGKMALDERSKAPAPVRAGASGAGMVSGGPMEGKIVTIYSPKGGTGCTTVAINLAVSLQNEETPVVIVDGNLQFGDIAVFLNEQARNNVADLAPRADELDPEVVEEVVINHAPSGVHILPAPTRPEEAEGVTGDQFSKLLTYLRKLYSYVIVDTTSSLTDVTLAAIDTSDLIILLTNQVIPAIKNARLFLDLADVLSIDRRRIIFIMNRYDKRIGITPDKVGESFKQDIVAVLPSDSRTVIPSVNRGRPFMLDDKSRPVARAMLVLTEKMRERLTELAKTDAEQEEEAGVGISLGRLIKH
jgi:pilus assembly protein CpaE